MGQKKRHTPFVWIHFGYVQATHSRFNIPKLIAKINDTIKQKLRPSKVRAMNCQSSLGTDNRD